MDARYIKPLDEELILEMARDVGHIVTVEEHVLDGGFGSAVLELLADKEIFDCRVNGWASGIPLWSMGHRRCCGGVYGVDAAAITAAAQKVVNHGKTTA